MRLAGGAQIGPFRLRWVYACRDGHVSITFLFGAAAATFTRRLMEWMFQEGFVDAATRDKDWMVYAAKLMSGEEPMSELQRCMARSRASPPRRRRMSSLPKPCGEAC